MKVEPAAKTNMSGFISQLGLSVRATNVLLYLNLKSAAEFLALDAGTLLRRRNCGRKTAAEIMEAVGRHTPPVDAAPIREMDPACELAAMENIPVTELPLSVRALGGLARLNICTLRQLAEVPDRELLRLWNFGKGTLREVRLKLELLRLRGFVLWPTDQGTAGGLSRRITAAARKVQRFTNSGSMLHDDPRFGHLIREIRLDGKNAREAAEMIVSRKVDPVYPQALMLRLTDLLSALETANGMSVEAELWSLTEGLGTERDRQIMVSHLGWDGKPPRTLEEVSHLHKMTRERVRQICMRIGTARSSKPFAPALDRALKAVTRAAPALAEDIESQLIQKRLTKTGFCMESLAAAAHDLGRQPHFGIERFHGNRVVVPANADGFLERIDRVARTAIRHWGVATVEDIAAATGTPVTLTQSILGFFPGFKWLDQVSGWFWIENQPRNSLLTQIGKILAACPCIDVGELRTGVGRHHRRQGFSPPKRVLLELCRQLPWCKVDGEKIIAAPPLDASELLSDSEQLILRILSEHGPVIQREKFEQLCLTAGMNHHSFWICLSYSPLICRHATGVYGLRGAEVAVGLVESLVPKRMTRSKLLVDYGWTDERNLEILYRVSRGMLSNGLVSIPAALKPFLQGRFTLITSDNSKIGTLVAKENSAWGLGPFFSRRGGEAGDYLSIVFQLPDKIATVQLGDESLTDRLHAPPRS